MEKVLKSIEEIKRKHDDEMAKYVIQHNDKYKKLMTEKLDFQDKFEEAEKEIARLKKEIDELKRKFTEKISNDQQGLNKAMQEMVILQILY